MGFVAARKRRESGNIIFNGLKAYIIGTDKSTTCCFIAEEMVIWKDDIPVKRLSNWQSNRLTSLKHLDGIHWEISKTFELFVFLPQ